MQTKLLHKIPLFSFNFLQKSFVFSILDTSIYKKYFIEYGNASMDYRKKIIYVNKTTEKEG